MHNDLKKAIANYVFDNTNEFQLHNHTTQEFRAYIYDDKGEYLIGGKDVARFIEQMVELATC